MTHRQDEGLLPTVHPQPRRTGVLATILLGAAMAACGCSSGSSSSSPPANHRPQTLLELRELLQAKQSRHDVQVEAAVRDCMRAAGFASGPADATTATTAATTGATPTDYGFARSVLASLEHLQSSTSDEAPVADSAPLSAGPQANAYNIALSGTSDGMGSSGCKGRALDQFGRGVLSDSVQQALDTAFASTSSDPRLAAAAAKWMACVHSANPTFTIHDPDAVGDYLTGRYRLLLTAEGLDPGLADGEVSPATAPRSTLLDVLRKLQTEETALATIDRACEKSSGYDAIEADWLATALRELPSDFFVTPST